VLIPQIIVNMLEGPTPVDSVGQGAAGKKIKLWLNNSNLLKFKNGYNLKKATNDFLWFKIILYLIVITVFCWCQ
jgi:hypothetical protein